MSGKMLTKLEKLGLQVAWEEKFIRHATFPLSPVEWCELCMRDGEHYLGGCCGQTSAIQDLLMMIFRDGGGADARDILNLMSTASPHGGFELFKVDFDLAKLGDFVDRWKELRPIEKIGVCCQAVRDHLDPKAVNVPDVENQDPKDPVRALQHSLEVLQWTDIFKPTEDHGQRHANRQVLLSRILPACRLVLKTAAPLLSKPFNGYAVVNGARRIMRDAHGYCIYGDESHAKAMLDMWTKAVDEIKKDGKLRVAITKLTVKPDAVDAAGGITWPKG